MKRINILYAIVVFFLVLEALVLVVPVHAYTVPNTVSVGWTGAASNTMILNVANSGDLITVSLQISDGSNAGKTSVSVVSVTDSKGNIYSLAIATPINIPPNCSAGNCFDNEIWWTTSKAAGSDTITMTLSQSTIIANAEAQDVAGIVPNLKSTATGNAATGMAYSTSTSLSFGPGDFVVSSIWTNCVAAGTLTAGSGFILQGNIAPFDGAAEYGDPANPPTSPTNFPYSCTINSRWIDNGAVFSAFALGVTTTTTTITVSSTETVAVQFSPSTSLTNVLGNQLGFSITGLIPTLIIVGALVFLFYESGFKDEKIIAFVMTLGFGICSVAGLIPLYIPIFIGITLFLVIIGGGAQKRVTG